VSNEILFDLKNISGANTSATQSSNIHRLETMLRQFLMLFLTKSRSQTQNSKVFMEIS